MRGSPLLESHRDPSPSNAFHYKQHQQQEYTYQRHDHTRHSSSNDEWSFGRRSRQRGHASDMNDELKERQRWSTWTADTSATALEVDDSFTHHHGRKDSSDDALTLLDKSHREQLPSSPPSPEDALNAALASMLSTANSLLISTMAARSDFARLQLMENALDVELDRREERVLMEIKNNEKMSQWMEAASVKLDTLLAESSTSSSRRPALISTYTPPLGTIAAGVSSELMARHLRAPSTSQINVHDASSSLGVFEAKDENATISKSAAKRLEKMLRRESSGGLPQTPSRATNTADDVSSRAPSRPSAQSSLNSLQVRLGMPAFSSATNTPAASSISAAAHFSLSPSSEASEYHPRTPSFTSESGPSSGMSSRAEEEEEEQEAEEGDVAQTAITKLTSVHRATLTPPTPCDDLHFLQDDVSQLQQQLHKRSASNLRSPNPAMVSRHTSQSSYISESQMSFDEMGGRASAKSSNASIMTSGSSKNALESLRKLNGGSFGHTTQQSSTSSPSWGGSLASWVGISSSSAAA